jgi:hypothetical protein
MSISYLCVMILSCIMAARNKHILSFSVFASRPTSLFVSNGASVVSFLVLIFSPQ